MRTARTASITEAKNQLSALLDIVRRGETVLILDRQRPVARLEPVRAAEGEPDPRLAALERGGILRRGLECPPRAWWKTRPPRAKKGASIVSALLD